MVSRSPLGSLEGPGGFSGKGPGRVLGVNWGWSGFGDVFGIRPNRGGARLLFWALENNFVSVVPINIDLTSYKSIDFVSKIFNNE